MKKGSFKVKPLALMVVSLCAISTFAVTAGQLTSPFGNGGRASIPSPTDNGRKASNHSSVSYMESSSETANNKRVERTTSVDGVIAVGDSFSHAKPDNYGDEVSEISDAYAASLEALTAITAIVQNMPSLTPNLTTLQTIVSHIVTSTPNASGWGTSTGKRLAYDATREDLWQNLLDAEVVLQTVGSSCTYAQKTNGECYHRESTRTASFELTVADKSPNATESANAATLAGIDGVLASLSSVLRAYAVKSTTPNKANYDARVATISTEITTAKNLATTASAIVAEASVTLPSIKANLIDSINNDPDILVAIYDLKEYLHVNGAKGFVGEDTSFQDAEVQSQINGLLRNLESIKNRYIEQYLAAFNGYRDSLITLIEDADAALSETYSDGASLASEVKSAVESQCSTASNHRYVSGWALGATTVGAPATSSRVLTRSGTTTRGTAHQREKCDYNTYTTTTCQTATTPYSTAVWADFTGSGKTNYYNACLSATSITLAASVAQPSPIVVPASSGQYCSSTSTTYYSSCNNISSK